ncbi:hypothetical protein ABZ635_26785 [Nocardiopsis sp. NPDC007018]|uniref:hypothetical protein n=1 Tax=Nocardiopsis sp. NPDC007018 TaxID=3155721 RepID=UPI0033FC2788
MSRTAAAVVALSLLLVGCGPGQDGGTGPAPEDWWPPSGGAPSESPPVPGADAPVSPDPTPGPSPEAPTTAPSASDGAGGGAEENAGQGVPEEAAAYMAALAAADDPARMRDGLTLAEEDSTAHAYLRHATQVASAREAAGEPSPDASLTPADDGFELCGGSPGAGGADPGTDCAVFTDFAAEDGLLTGFLVDGADPGKRLVTGHGVTASSEGVDVHLLTAYQDAAVDGLVVTAEFTTVDAADVDLPGAVYTGPDGDTHRPRDAVGEYELDPGATTQTVLTYPGARLGGELTVTGCLSECQALVDLRFPVE